MPAILWRRRGARHLHHRAADREPRRHGVPPQMTPPRGRHLSRLASVSATPRRPDLAHHLQRRPGAGAPRPCRVQVPKGFSHPAVTLGVLDPCSRVLARLRRDHCAGPYDGAVDEASVLRRSVGRRVVFRAARVQGHAERARAGADPLRLQLPDGRVTFSPPGPRCTRATSWRPSRPRASSSRAPRAQDKLRLGLLHRGRPWLASYQVVLGAARDARVTGAAVL